MTRKTHLERDGIVAILTTDEHGSFGLLASGERFAVEDTDGDHEELVGRFLRDGWRVITRE